MGYIGYNKSYRNNFLDQKIIHNKEEDYVLVKGDFEPIIPEDVWYACRDLRMDRSTTVPALVKSKQMRIGVTPSTDVWTNKLRCACGSKFKRYKWRQDKDGQRHFGYSCYSRFNNGSAGKRQELGLDTEGYCDMPSVNETKLDVMAAVLFDTIMEDKEDVIEEAVKTLNETLKEIRTESKRDFSGYQIRIEKAEKKLDTLLAIRGDQQGRIRSGKGEMQSGDQGTEKRHARKRAGSPERREYRHGLRPRPARKNHRKRKRKGGQRRADGVHRHRYGREGQYLPVGPVAEE